MALECKNPESWIRAVNGTERTSTALTSRETGQRHAPALLRYLFANLTTYQWPIALHRTTWTASGRSPPVRSQYSYVPKLQGISAFCSENSSGASTVSEEPFHQREVLPPRLSGSPPPSGERLLIEPQPPGELAPGDSLPARAAFCPALGRRSAFTGSGSTWRQAGDRDLAMRLL
jgi:hypothetical protein